MDNDYYVKKFRELTWWLELEEQYADARAMSVMESDRNAAEKHLQVSATAKRARMWIRNHVHIEDPTSVEEA